MPDQISKITVNPYGHVYVRVIREDGAYHRYVIAPGDDYSNEPPEVHVACAAAHTPEVIAAYQEA